MSTPLDEQQRRKALLLLLVWCRCIHRWHCFLVYIFIYTDRCQKWARRSTFFSSIIVLLPFSSASSKRKNQRMHWHIRLDCFIGWWWCNHIVFSTKIDLHLICLVFCPCFMCRYQMPFLKLFSCEWWIQFIFIGKKRVSFCNSNLTLEECLNERHHLDVRRKDTKIEDRSYSFSLSLSHVLLLLRYILYNAPLSSFVLIVIFFFFY